MANPQKRMQCPRCGRLVAVTVTSDGSGHPVEITRRHKCQEVK